ncbi:BESS domain-containing protein, partial [Aphis craccivora]
ETVKATWAKLRSCHRDALRRQKRCFKSGAAAEIIKQWKFQKQMEYLLPYMTNRKRSSNVLDSKDEDDFIQSEITGTEQISENNYDIEAPTLENDNEIVVHKNNEHDINVEATEDSVEGMINTTSSLASQKSGFKQPLKKKKDDITNLLQQSIASREQSAKERALEPVSIAEANLLNIPTTFQQTIHEQPRSTAAWSYEQNSLSSHETSSSDTYYVNTQTCENSND